MCWTSPKSHLSAISHPAVLFPFLLLLVFKLRLYQLELFSCPWPVPLSCISKRCKVLVRDSANCCSGATAVASCYGSPGD